MYPVLKYAMENSRRWKEAAMQGQPLLIVNTLLFEFEVTCMYYFEEKAEQTSCIPVLLR